MAKPLVLITGADGLLGSHLVRKLLDKNFAVRVIVQPGSTSPTLCDLPIEIIKGDLLDEGQALADAFTGCEYVFHCAAITDIWANPEIVWKVNFEGTKKVLDACCAQSIKRLIFTGSASSFQFGTIDRPGDETGTFAPHYRGVAYMESKHKAMELVQQYCARGDLEAIIVAPTFMLGNLDSRPSSGELIRQFINRGFRFVSPGGRNFAYAPDVADGMIAAMTKGTVGECYIAGGRNLTYMDFFGRVAEAAGTKPPALALPEVVLTALGGLGQLYGKVTGARPALDLTTAKLAVMGTYYSSEKAVRELGMPQTDINTGIEKTLEGLREYGYIQ